MTQYMLMNAEPRNRLAAIEALLDPGSVRLMESLETGQGWRCLEVGAGAGSIAAWLAHRVGPHGYVLATDLDPRYLEELAVPNLEVRRHDIATDELPEGAFDLVHARLVLEHLSERETALDRMIAALKPGGWLLVESGDYISWTPLTTEPAERAALFTKASLAALQYLPFDILYGRRVVGDLRARGLTEVAADGRVFVIRGGSPDALPWRAVWTTYEERLVNEGVLAAEEIAGLIALHDDPEFMWLSPIVLAAWGRRQAITTANPCKEPFGYSS
jgi:SAM-dependent methyltransferase